MATGNFHHRPGLNVYLEPCTPVYMSINVHSLTGTQETVREETSSAFCPIGGEEADNWPSKDAWNPPEHRQCCEAAALAEPC